MEWNPNYLVFRAIFKIWRYRGFPGPLKSTGALKKETGKKWNDTTKSIELCNYDIHLTIFSVFLRSTRHTHAQTSFHRCKQIILGNLCCCSYIFWLLVIKFKHFLVEHFAFDTSGNSNYLSSGSPFAINYLPLCPASRPMTLASS